MIAWVRSLPGFPDDASIIIAEWAVELLPLSAGTTADAITGQLA